VFLFEKRCAEKLHKPKRKETVTELLRASVKQLERFRHPKVTKGRTPLSKQPFVSGICQQSFYCFQILQIIHTVEECPETLAFATEPVLASLANILAFYVSESSSSQVQTHLL
jgi:SCY1-like protein 2